MTKQNFIYGATCILIQVIVGFFALTRRIHTTFDASIVLACYPLSLFFVYALQNWAGMA